MVQLLQGLDKSVSSVCPAFILYTDVVKELELSFPFRCLEEDLQTICALSSRCLVRLTQNLIKLIDVSMDVSDSASELAVPSMLPWVLLYRLVLQLVSFTILIISNYSGPDINDMVAVRSNVPQRPLRKKRMLCLLT